MSRRRNLSVTEMEGVRCESRSWEELEEHSDRAAHTKLLDLGLSVLCPLHAPTSAGSSSPPSKPKVSWRFTSRSISRNAERNADESSSRGRSRFRAHSDS
jgi:hypothetical protein